MILLVGSPGTGKTTFIQQFVYDSLRRGDPCIYLLTDYTPEIAVENMKFLGYDVDGFLEDGRLRFVDCYSGPDGVESASTFVVESVRNLTDLSMELNRAAEGFDKMCFALNSITTLALNAGLNPTREFLRRLILRHRKLDCLGVCSFEEGVVEKSFESFLRAQYDGVLEMRLDVSDSGEFRRYLRVFTLSRARHSTQWSEMTLGKMRAI